MHTVPNARGLVLNGAVRRELALVRRAVALVVPRAGQLTVRKLLDGALSRQYALTLCIVAHPVSVWHWWRRRRLTRRVAGCLCRNVPVMRQYTPRACAVAHPVRAPWRWRRRAYRITRSPGRNVARGRQHALPFRTVALPVLRSRRRRRRRKQWAVAVCIAGRQRRPSAVISKHTQVI